jgi:hypothetical protein
MRLGVAHDGDEELAPAQKADGTEHTLFFVLGILLPLKNLEAVLAYGSDGKDKLLLSSSFRWDISERSLDDEHVVPFETHGEKTQVLDRSETSWDQSMKGPDRRRSFLIAEMSRRN